MSTCARAKTDKYRVVVKFPKSMTTRCGECWRAFATVCALCWHRLRTACGNIFYYGLLGVLVAAVVYSSSWVVWIVRYCHRAPNLVLEDLSIDAMAVYYQNNTTSTDMTPWQVTSEMGVTLSARNRNTVAGCFTTCRRMDVRVEYKGQLVLQEEVALGFGLKPRRSRSVSVGLKGDHFPLQRELGSVLEGELRNATAVELQFYFDVRYLRNDRKAGWKRMKCDVIAKTPANNSAVKVGSGGLISSQCLQ